MTGPRLPNVPDDRIVFERTVKEALRRFRLEMARQLQVGFTTEGPITGDLIGNASTATALQTTRTIWGQNFNGTANVSGAFSGATTGAFSSHVTIGGTVTVSGVGATDYSASITGRLRASFDGEAPAFLANGLPPYHALSHGSGDWGLVVTRAANDGDGAGLSFYHTRGASASLRVALINGDIIGGFGWHGPTSASVVNSGAYVIGRVNGTVSSGVLPTQVEVHTTASGNVVGAAATIAAIWTPQRHYLPGANSAYDLGASATRWNNLWLGGTATATTVTATTVNASAVQNVGGTLTVTANQVTVNATGMTVNADTFTHAGGNITANLAQGSSFSTTFLGSATSTNTTYLVLRSGSVQNRFIQWRTAGNARWEFGVNSAAESGANAGSALVSNAYTDAGALIDAWLTVTRASGGTIAFASARPITAGTYNGQTLSSAANFTGTVTIASTLFGPTRITGSASALSLGTDGSGVDQAATTFAISAPRSTGNATPAGLSWSVGVQGASGASLQTLNSAWLLQEQANATGREVTAMNVNGPVMGALNTTIHTVWREAADGGRFGARVKVIRVAASAFMSGVRGNGSLSVPTQVLSGESAFTVEGRAIDDTSTQRIVSSIQFVAAENVTSTASGGRLQLRARVLGSLTDGLVATFESPASGVAMITAGQSTLRIVPGGTQIAIRDSTNAFDASTFNANGTVVKLAQSTSSSTVNVGVATGGTGLVSVDSADTAEVSYQWNRNGARIWRWIRVQDSNGPLDLTASVYDTSGVLIGSFMRMNHPNNGTSTAGTLVSSYPIHGQTGSAATPTFSFASDPDTGMYRVGANIIAWSSSGAEALRLTNTLITQTGTDANFVQSTTSATVTIGTGSGSGATTMRLRGAAGTIRGFHFQTDTTLRWNVFVNNTAETGSNAGSPFGIAAYDDAGVNIDTPLSITRATGGTIAFATARPITGGTFNGQTINATASFTGTVTIATTLTTNGTTVNLAQSATVAVVNVGTGTGSGVSQVNVQGASGQLREYSLRTGTSPRWKLYANSDAESGSDAGSTFIISAFTDAGAAIDNPVSIVRAANGAITLGGGGNRQVIIAGSGWGAGNASLRLNGLTSGAAASVGTLNNAPAAGDPAFWIPINLAGTVRYVPAW